MPKQLPPLGPIRPATIYPAGAQTFQDAEPLNYANYIILLLTASAVLGTALFCLLKPNNRYVSSVTNCAATLFCCGRKKNNAGGDYSLVATSAPRERRMSTGG